MKLHLSQTSGQYAITAFSEGCVHINHQAYQHSLIITPSQLDTQWPISDMQQLRAEHMQQLLAYQPEIVLIGCGARHQFLHPKISAPLLQVQIAVETMTTAAACRTYNILLAEGRRVLAALII